MQRFVRLVFSGNIAFFFHRFRLALFPGEVHPSLRPVSPGPKKKTGTFPFSGTASSPVRVLFVSHDLKYEGAARSLFELVRAFHKRGCLSPRLLAFGEGKLLRDYEQLGIPVDLVPQRWDELTTPDRIRRCVDFLAERIKPGSFDLIFVNTMASFPALLAADRAQIPAVWNIREGVSPEIFYRALPLEAAREAAACAELAEKIIFVSDASRNAWAAYESLSRFEVIKNAPDPHFFQPNRSPVNRTSIRGRMGLSSDDCLIFSAASVEARKGQKDLIEAFNLLPPALRERTHLAFAGSLQSNYAGRLVKGSAGHDSQRIHWLDEVEDVRPLYDAADIFVLCSRSESYPRVILEAMAAGLPIVTTPVAGVPEQVSEGENAFFYQPGAALELAEFLTRLIESRELMTRMGDRSKMLFSEFLDFEGMIDRYLHSIKSVFVHGGALEPDIERP